MTNNTSTGTETISKESIQRRQRSFDEHYSTLSPDQIEGVYSLTKFGYILEFVRSSDDGTKLAVMSCDKKIAVITNVGDIDFSPILKMRSWS